MCDLTGPGSLVTVPAEHKCSSHATHYPRILTDYRLFHTVQMFADSAAPQMGGQIQEFDNDNLLYRV